MLSSKFVLDIYKSTKIILELLDEINNETRVSFLRTYTGNKLLNLITIFVFLFLQFRVKFLFDQTIIMKRVLINKC